RGDSGESTETSRMNLHRVERPLVNRCQRRARTYLWVPSIAVEFCFTTAKFGISSLAGIRIEFLDCVFQTLRVNSTFAGEFFDGLAFLQIARGNIREKRHGERLSHAQGVLTHEAGISNLPRRHWVTIFCCFDHAVDIVEVAVGFI